MNFDPNDPRLTAFALDELVGGERAEVEALLGQSAEGHRYVEEVRAYARLLTEILCAEPSPGLSLEHRQAIDAGLHAAPAVPAVAPRRGVRWVPILTAAASLLLVAGLSLSAYNAARPAGRRLLEIARVESPMARETRSPATETSPEAVGRSGAESRSARPIPRIAFSTAEVEAIDRPAPQAASAAKAVDERALATFQGRQLPPKLPHGAGSAAPPVLGRIEASRTASAARADAPSASPAPVFGREYASIVSGGGSAGAGMMGGMAGGMGGSGGGMGGMSGGRGRGAVPAQDARRLDRAENLGFRAGKPGGSKSGESAQSLATSGRGVVREHNLRRDMYGLPAGGAVVAAETGRKKSFEDLSRERQRTPGTVGVQGGNAGNFSPDLGLPFTQGSANLMNPVNASPPGQRQGQQQGQGNQGQPGQGRGPGGQGQGGQGQGQGQGQSHSRPKDPFDQLALSRETGQVRLAEVDKTRNEAVESLSLSKGKRDAVEAEQIIPPAAAPVTDFLDVDAAAIRDPQLAPQPDAEQFDRHTDNPFVPVALEPLSTFSIDVDTASYANVRRFLNQNTLPPVDAVRIEEMLNYFPYHDPAPTGEHPLAVHAEVGGCPWNPDHRLMRVAMTSKPIPAEGRPLCSLTFLVDVSGSMDQPNKLPLVKASLRKLVEALGENDRLGIVVYAGASGLVLPSTSCLKKAEILSAIENLQAGGSTNGGAGIQLAYDEAVKHFIKGGANRVVLATDGDFNVGISDRGRLVQLIEAKRRSGVYLSVLGFGMGNLKDGQLEALADKGNGNYAYIDSLDEAEKVLIKEMGATLVTVAKDVKLQIEFNPAKVGAYRLIGYENRMLAAQDFADDAKDAGEVGAGHHVTALYELVPPGKEGAVTPAAAEEREFPTEKVAASPRPETLVVKVRYKRPDEETSRPFKVGVVDKGLDFSRSSADFKFASAVAGFGMVLRHSPYKGSMTFAGVVEIAGSALADDPSGYRKEFVSLVRRAQAISPR